METKLLEHLDEPDSFEGQFTAIALEQFGYQFENNLPYRRYCEFLGASPDHSESWRDIPAVPTDVFKHFPLATFPTDRAVKTFLTSGTTQDVRGSHYFPTTAIYEKSIIAAWQHLKLPPPTRPFILCPHPDHAPSSSLSHMMGTMVKHFSVGDQDAIWMISPDGKLNADAILSLQRETLPLALLGTALSFIHLFENLPSQLALPEGSWAMETGGYKGSNKTLEKAELYSLFQDKLGISPASIINEYSMTELSSQFYTQGLDPPHYGPPWARVRVINPRTGNDAPSGQIGHLAVYDLANLHSVMAIQTQDLAIAHTDGSFSLIGRDPTALPRGCSRAAEEQLTS
ncbi:MAG: long-chain fatty acid--CoA ligase [Akkermansiaceae bacterium]